MNSRGKNRFIIKNYQPKKYINPYKSNIKKPKNFKISSLLKIFSYKKFWFFLFFLGIIYYILFASGWFIIKNIDVIGTQFLPIEDLKLKAWQQTESNIFGILPQKYIFTFNQSSYLKTIQQSYIIHDLNIKIKWPNQLLIRVNELEPLIIYRENGSEYLIDNQGRIIVELPAGHQYKLRLLVNNGPYRLKDNSLSLPNYFYKFIKELDINWSNSFADQKIKYFRLTESDNNLILSLENGPLIYFNPNESVNQQLEKLKLIWEVKWDKKIPKLNYIDLRFGDKVFYQ